MPDDKQIDKWLEQGTITKEQAQQMRADVKQQKQDERSNKLITTVSTIGALCIGIAAILFVASNWNQISDIQKTLLLIVSTFGSLGLGYHLQYQRQNLPRVGAALIFLSAIMFGASIFLIAQIYNIQANAHSLMLIWLLGVLPLVYAFNSYGLASIASFVFFGWVLLFIYRNLEFQFEYILQVPVILLTTALFVFSIGQIHYAKKSLSKIARTYRIIGLKIAMFSLFLLTLRVFTRSLSEIDVVAGQILTTSVIFAVATVIAATINLLNNYNQSASNILENSASIVLVVLALLAIGFRPDSYLFTIVFNILFIGIIGILYFKGYDTQDIKLVNIAAFWTGVFIIYRYFDFFWALLPRSAFFLAGGVILIGGGVYLEKKRRKLKESFTEDE